MGLEYLDLWLAHWPTVWKPVSKEALVKAKSGPNVSREEKGMIYEADKPVVDWEHCTRRLAKAAGKEGSFVPTWKAMQECVHKGKAKSVGVSNFNIEDLQELLPHGGDVPVACNQIEVHPWLPQREMVKFAEEHGIVISCYSPFAGQKKDGATLLKDEKVLKLAEKNGMDVGQLLGSWAVQRGTVPLGKSQTPSRIKSNLDVKKLSEEDVKALDDMEVPNGEGRTVNNPEGELVPTFKD
jgi:glycerol 2-dehydrogenase (NADP+)